MQAQKEQSCKPNFSANERRWIKLHKFWGESKLFHQWNTHRRDEDGAEGEPTFSGFTHQSSPLQSVFSYSSSEMFFPAFNQTQAKLGEIFPLNFHFITKREALGWEKGGKSGKMCISAPNNWQIFLQNCSHPHSGSLERKTACSVTVLTLKIFSINFSSSQITRSHWRFDFNDFQQSSRLR